MAGATATAQHAQGNFTIYPTYMHGENSRWIILDAAQGSTLRDFITLENLTEETQKINLSAAEAEEKGDSYLVKDTPTDNNFTSWIKFEKNEYILEPGQKIKVPFEISVPNGAEILTHSGAILASQEFNDEHSLNIVTRIGVRLYLNVVTPGTPLNNTASVLATLPSPFGIGSFANSPYFIGTSLMLAAAAVYTATGALTKRKYAKKQA